MSGNEIVEQAFRDFDEWVKSQEDEVQELDIEQLAELYAAATAS
ncbi:hypothetical protein [Rhizobium lentis]|nr:hypothetical protein [Rhizobium lentis]